VARAIRKNDAASLPEFIKQSGLGMGIFDPRASWRSETYVRLLLGERVEMLVWALLASPTCRPSGPGSTRCSAFLGNNRTHTRTESLPVVVPVRNEIFVGRD
jgi:hypothetical protein